MKQARTDQHIGFLPPQATTDRAGICKQHVNLAAIHKNRFRKIIPMRTCLIMLLVFSCATSFAQGIKSGDALQNGFYDTISIEIQGTKVFPFCGNLYQLPRECSENLPTNNCCGYNTSIRKGQKLADWGYVNCHNGSVLSWTYYSSLAGAQKDADNFLPQWKKQQKELKVEKIKCYVMGTETESYDIEMESLTGYKSYVLLTYGTHNGYSFTLEYRSLQKITSDNNIQAFLQPILRLK